MPAPSLPSTFTRTRRAPGLGESVLRPDAPAKTNGQFAFSSDLWMDGMVWGATLRSPHPHARIRSIRFIRSGSTATRFHSSPTARCSMAHDRFQTTRRSVVRQDVSRSFHGWSR